MRCVKVQEKQTFWPCVEKGRMRQPQTFSYGDYVTDWTTRLLKICPSYQILDIRTKQVVLRTPECLIVRENSLCRLSYFIIQLGMQGLQHRGHFLYREAGTEKLTPAQAELVTQPCCKAPLDLTQLCEGTIKFELCVL